MNDMGIKKKSPTVITPDMTLLDIVEKYPDAKEVLGKYDTLAGECLLCYNLFDPLKKVIEKYGLNGEKLMNELHALGQLPRKISSNDF